MYEYEIIHKITRKREIIFGYTWVDAFRRAGLDGKEYDCVTFEYID